MPARRTAAATSAAGGRRAGSGMPTTSTFEKPSVLLQGVCFDRYRRGKVYARARNRSRKYRPRDRAPGPATAARWAGLTRAARPAAQEERRDRADEEGGAGRLGNGRRIERRPGDAAAVAATIAPAGPHAEQPRRGGRVVLAAHDRADPVEGARDADVAGDVAVVGVVDAVGHLAEGVDADQDRAAAVVKVGERPAAGVAQADEVFEVGRLGGAERAVAGVARVVEVDDEDARLLRQSGLIHLFLRAGRAVDDVLPGALEPVEVARPAGAGPRLPVADERGDGAHFPGARVDGRRHDAADRLREPDQRQVVALAVVPVPLRMDDPF